MPLTFDGLFGNKHNLFSENPDDDQVMTAAGNRQVPADQTVNTDTQALDWKGAWDSGTGYVIDDWVENDGAAYRCKASTTNNEPPNAT